MVATKCCTSTRDTRNKENIRYCSFLGFALINTNYLAEPSSVCTPASLIRVFLFCCFLRFWSGKMKVRNSREYTSIYYVSMSGLSY